MCEALYPTLNAAEIALRNSINVGLASFSSDENWFERKLDDGALLLESDQFEQISTARSRLRKRGSLECPGRVVAELSFGFWVSLLNRPYEAKIWAPNNYALIREVFPNATRRERKRWWLRDQFAEINELRNRVFHYEPIGYRKTLDEEHQRILRAIGWISPVMRDSIARFDRFPVVYQMGREHVEAEIRQHLGM